MTQITTGFEFIFALALMLGVVITVHEFGHFIVAKMCGVRVLKFSIGFGSAVGIGRFRLRWERNGTEYVVAWLPLGGYVKMLGENPGDSEEVPGGPGTPLEEKPLWQKLLILLAGPGMNLVLPVVIFVISFAVGVNRPSSVVGSVERGSPAESAGFEAGDRVLRVGETPVDWWDDFQEIVREHPGELVNLEVERRGNTLTVPVKIGTRQGLDVFRTVREVGWVGLQHSRQKAVVGIVSLDTPAGKAGLRSGDLVTHVNGSAVKSWLELAHVYKSLIHESEIEFQIARGNEIFKFNVELSKNENLESFGVFPAVVVVEAVEAGSAAENAGLVTGDMIISVDDKPIGSFATFQELVLASSGRSLNVSAVRNGKSRQLEVTPKLMSTDLGGGNKESLYRIGIQGVNSILGGVLAIDREINPFVSIPRAIKKTADITVMFLQGLKKLVVGEISRKHIGGPIEIAKQSYNAFQSGWGRFLNVLILISINIGILNLLPIPMLDGGQALMYSIEGVKRKPLSLRTREMVQRVGVVLLLLLMSFAFWNDLSRHWSSFVGWIRGF